MVATTTASVPSKEQDWADIEDDDEEESVPTVNLDMNSLSLDDKNKAQGNPEGDPR